MFKFQQKQYDKAVNSTLRASETIIKRFEPILINSIAGSAPKNAWGEEVKSKTSAGSFVITNERVFHIGSTGFTEVLKEIPAKMIGSVENKTILNATEIKIYSTSGTLIYLNTVPKNIAVEIIAAVNQLIENSNSAGPAKSEIDIPTQIKKLSELKDQGILTEDEFNKKKSELLSKM